jgi:chemotaxis protein MotB
MMTLLCGFFILLFSMSKLDTPKYDSFSQELSKQLGVEYVSPTKELAKFATQILNETGLETGVVVKSDPLGVSIIFESTVFFETLSAEVTEQGKKTLLQLIDGLAKKQKEIGKTYRIVVEGHTDSRPITGGVYPSNWELSGARAARVVRLFLERGFTADHLTAIGYADTHPQVEARLPDGRWNETALSKNRRVVLRILEPKVDAIPFPDAADPKAAAAAPAGNAVPVKPAAPVNPPAVNPGIVPTGPKAVPAVAPKVSVPPAKAPIRPTKVAAPYKAQPVKIKTAPRNSIRGAAKPSKKY